MVGIGPVIALAGALNTANIPDIQEEPQFDTTPAQVMEVAQNGIQNCLDIRGKITRTEQDYIRQQAQGRSFVQLSDRQARIEQARSGNFDTISGGNCFYIVLGEGMEYGHRYILVSIPDIEGSTTKFFL